MDARYNAMPGTDRKDGGAVIGMVESCGDSYQRRKVVGADACDVDPLHREDLVGRLHSIDVLDSDGDQGPGIGLGQFISQPQAVAVGPTVAQSAQTLGRIPVVLDQSAALRDRFRKSGSEGLWFIPLSPLTQRWPGLHTGRKMQ